MFRIKPQRTQLAWQAPAAVAFFALAIIAILAGTLLTTAWILNAQVHPTLYGLGLVSLILALPVALLGAHCLDLLDQQRKRSNAR